MCLCLQCIWKGKMPILEGYKCKYVFGWKSFWKVSILHNFGKKKLIEMDEMSVWFTKYGMEINKMSVYLQCIWNENG